MDATTARTLLTEEQRRLEATRAGLRAGVEEVGAGGPTETAGADSADLVAREVEHAVLARLDRDQADVADALRRLDAGTYGTCQTCGEAIPDGRLEAVPATRFCVDHEVAAEVRAETAGVDGEDTPPSAESRLLAEARAHLDDQPEEPGADDGLGSEEEQAMHVDHTAS